MPSVGSAQYFDLGSLKPLMDDGVTLLTPNLRLARRIKSEWDRQQIQQGKQSWAPAAVYAVDHWLREQWQARVNAGQLATKRVLTAQQQDELWRQVIAQDCDKHMNYNLLRIDAAAALAQQARDNLLRSRVPLSAAEVLSEFGFDADCATFLRWLGAFEKLLTSQEFFTAADCVAALLTVPAQAPAETAALVDFDDIPPLYRAAVAAHATLCGELDSGTEQAPVCARSYPDRRTELAAVAEWAAAAYSRNQDCRLGIVLVDMHGDRAELEYRLRQTFKSLGDNYTSLPVNFSTSITLDQAPVVRDALRMLLVGERSMAIGDVLALLKTRFSPVAGCSSDVSVKMLQTLFSDGSEQVSLGRLRQLAAKVSVGQDQGLAIAASLTAVNAMRLSRKQCLPSAWVAVICEILDSFSWPGAGPLDSLEYQQVESWYTALEALSGFDAFSGELNYGDCLALLRRCCQNIISQPQTADSGIQVLGPLEGAGLQFEEVWLCGLQGSRWPAPARPNPFIPMPLQKRFSMPHSSAEREWQYALTLMNQYRCGCHNLVTSYSRQVDGVPELPSPMLKGMDIEQVQASAGLNSDWSLAQSNSPRTVMADNRAPAIVADAGTPMSGGSGLLQAQANCPFKAFASKRLLAEPLDEYRVGLSAAERGSLLHDALYALWGELQDSSTLHAMAAEALAGAVNTAVQSALDAIADAVKHRVGAHCIDLERERLQSLLHEWLDHERGRDRFMVVAREEPMILQLGQLTLNLRVDRIDELGDGSRLVIDYKSGRSSLSSWLGERPSQPQLPLYGISGDADGVAFAQLRTRDCKMIGLGQAAGVPGVQEDIAKAVKRYSVQEDWPGLVTEWRQNIERLAEQFLAGAAEVDPLPGACKFCGLQALCRVELAEHGA